MSDIDLPLRIQEYASSAPLRGAQLFKSLEEIPLTQAQTGVEQARIPLVQAETVKTQTEAEMQRFLLGARKEAYAGGFGQPQGPTSVNDQTFNRYPQASTTSYDEPPSSPQAPAWYHPQPLPKGQQDNSVSSPVTGGTSSPVTGAPPTAYASRFPPGSYQLASAGDQFPVPQGSAFLGAAAAQPGATSPAPAATAPQPGATSLAPGASPPGSAALMQSATPGAAPTAAATKPPLPSEMLARQNPNFNPQGVSGNGTYIPGVGALPSWAVRQARLAIAEGKDPSEILAHARMLKYQHLAELAQQAQTPAEWNAALLQAYRDGSITAGQVVDNRDAFGRKDEMILSMTTAAEQINAQLNASQQGMAFGSEGLRSSPPALAAIELAARARATGDPRFQQVTVEDPTRPGHYITRNALPGELPLQFQPGGGGGGQGGVGGGGPLPTDKEAARAEIIRRESGGDPTALNHVAQHDPSAYARGATASGLYGMTNSTWTEGARTAGVDTNQYPTARSAPAAVQDKVYDAVWAKYGNRPWDASKFSKNWVRGADGRYSLQPVRQTSQAGGGPPATQVAQAGGGITSRIPGAYQTAAMGFVPPPTGGEAPAGGVTQAQYQPLPPGGGWWSRGTPALAPGQGDIQKNNIEADNTAVNNSNAIAGRSLAQMRTVKDMLARADRIGESGFGSGAEGRTTATNFVHTYFGNNYYAETLLKKLSGWDFSNLEDRQAFIKEAINLATQQGSELTGNNEGIGFATLMSKATPNINMQQGTVKDLLNWLLVGHQQIQDYARGLGERVQDTQSHHDMWSGDYQPVKRQFDHDWLDPAGSHSPAVYEAAAGILNGRPKSNYGKELGNTNDSDPQKRALARERWTEAWKIARRANADVIAQHDQ